MAKSKVNNVSAVCFVGSEADPGAVFLSVKDDGHPIKLVRRQLCPIGGNWVGAKARGDMNPFDTMARELREELTLDRPRRNSVELYELGLAGPELFDPTPIDREASAADRTDLGLLVQVIIQRSRLHSAWLHTVTAEAMVEADPDCKAPTFTTLSYAFVTLLTKSQWVRLMELQRQYGNLSNEAPTLVVRLSEVASTGRRFAFGHDAAASAMGALGLPRVNGVESVRVDTPKTSYGQILDDFEVAKRP